MKAYGTPRPWPPEVDQELMQLLRGRRFRGLGKEEPPAHPGLATALDELDAWLDDPRPYQGQHRRAWSAMGTDVQHALGTRGPRLTELTPALTALTAELAVPLVGGNAAVRHTCRQLSQTGRGELAAPSAARAAFDDLVQALQDPSQPHVTVIDRLETLDAALAVASRAFAAIAGQLADIMDNGAFEIYFALAELDGTSSDDPPDLTADADLTAEERLQVCRRLIEHSPTSGQHVVWLAYDRARLRVDWFVQLGPVSFFEGPALIGALESLGQDCERYLEHFQDVLPPELLADTLRGAIVPETTSLDRSLRDVPRWLHTRHLDTEDWVAVRVNLGASRRADPIPAARQQADALVALAAFHGNGTSWRALQGYGHLVDGRPRQWSSFTPPFDDRPLLDHTGELLDELGPDVAGHLPITDGRLLELLDAADVVQAHRHDDADPTTLLNDVRVIELVASRCDTEWRDHLLNTFALAWAHSEILDELYGAVAALTEHEEIADLAIMPPPHLLLEDVSDGSGRVWIRYDRALSAVPDLATQLPAHAPGARRIRELAARTADPSAVQEWVTDLLADYRRRVERLSRCRNSLAHGGPIDLRVAATVKRFANRQAARTTSTALWGVIRGEGVAAAHATYRAREEAWQVHLGSAATVPEALALPVR